MADIVVNGVTYNGVESIAMQDTSGEKIMFYPETVSYLVVFSTEGGFCETAYVYTDASGKLGSLPEATREGYSFLGWQTEDGTDVTADTVFTADTVLYAQWKRTLTITVTGEGAALMCYVTINGENVYSAGTYYVEENATIACSASAGSSRYTYIYLNEIKVKSGTGRQTYSYAATKNATIELYYSYNYAAEISITEEGSR